MRDSAVCRSVCTVTSPVVVPARSSARSNTFRIVVYGFFVLAFVAKSCSALQMTARLEGQSRCEDRREISLAGRSLPEVFEDGV